MYKYIYKNDGAALIMVLIMLVVVAGLAGGLLAATTFNTRFSGDEIDRNQAFYAADAGVEFTKSFYYNGFPSGLNSGDKITGNDNKIIDNSLEFFVKVEEVSSDEIVFISTGINNRSDGNLSNQASIRFNLIRLPGDLNNMNIKKKDGIDETYHYNLTGDNDGAVEERISIVDWDFDTFEDYYNYFLNDPDSLTHINDGNISDSTKFDDGTKGNFSGYATEKDIVDENVFIENNLKISGNPTIKNSIIVVDGHLEFNISSGFYIENSVIIVRENFELSGSSPSVEWENPLFLIYGDYELSNKEPAYIDMRGLGDFVINFDSFDKLPIGFNSESSGSFGSFVHNWRIAR